MDTKRTKLIAIVLAVVLAVSGIAAGLAALSGSAGGPAERTAEQEQEQADDAAPAAAPYAAAACPDPLPNPGQAGLTLPNLDNIASVRLCGADAEQVPADALVEGLGGFTRAVADLPPADTDLCAAAGTGAPTTSLALELDDGRQVLVRTGACAGLLSGRDTISGIGVVTAFLDALDAQREDGTYEPPAAVADAETSCAQTPTTAPVTPGRETIAVALVCASPDAVPEPLADEALGTLTDAWDTAPAPKEGACDATDGPGQGFVMVRTDLGDVVRLLPGCGGLVLDSSDLDDSGLDFTVALTSVVPVTLADLGG